VILNDLKELFLNSWGKEFQIFTPMYFNDFWARDVENLGIYKSLLELDLVERSEYVEIVFEKKVKNQVGREFVECWCISFAISNLYKSEIFNILS